MCGGEFSLPHGHVVASAVYPLARMFIFYGSLPLAAMQSTNYRRARIAAERPFQQLTQPRGRDSSVNDERLVYSEYISKAESMRVPDGECVRKT